VRLAKGVNDSYGGKSVFSEPIHPIHVQEEIAAISGIYSGSDGAEPI
jgi:hypothetical protein